MNNLWYYYSATKIMSWQQDIFCGQCVVCYYSNQYLVYKPSELHSWIAWQLLVPATHTQNWYITIYVTTE